MKTAVQAFASSRLDYCNSLLSGVTDILVQHLRSVQNAAARLVTGIRRCEHITPVLRQLYWLPVRQRIEFKIAILVYKSLNAALSLRYLMDDCQLITTTGRRRLRSSNVATFDETHLFGWRPRRLVIDLAAGNKVASGYMFYLWIFVLSQPHLMWQNGRSLPAKSIPTLRTEVWHR